MHNVKDISNKYYYLDGKKYVKFEYLCNNRGKIIEYVGKKTYRIKEDIIFFVDYENKNEFVIVPKGFIFDFNSSPKFAHVIVDTDEYCIALIHDYLYSRSGRICVRCEHKLSKFVKKYDLIFGKDYTRIDYDRKFADKIWLIGAIVEKTEFIKKPKTFLGFINFGFKILFFSLKCRLGYLGIRLGGKKHFKK